MYLNKLMYQNVIFIKSFINLLGCQTDIEIFMLEQSQNGFLMKK